MDVQDRTARIDVLNLSAPVKEPPGTPAISIHPDGAFAASMRSQGISAANPPATALSVDESELALIDGAIATGNEVSSPFLAELLLTAVPRETAADAITANDPPPEIAPETDDEIDSAAQQFLASMAAADNVPRSPFVPVVYSAPAGLARAIAALAEHATKISAVLSTPAEPPAMPPGLQIALTTSPAAVDHVAAQSPQPGIASPTASSKLELSENMSQPIAADSSAVPQQPGDAADLKSSLASEPNKDKVAAADGRKKSEIETATRAAEIAPVAAASPLSFANSDGVARTSEPRGDDAAAARLPPAIQPADERDRSTEISPWSGPASIARGELRAESATPPVHVAAAPAIIEQLEPALARAVAGERPLSIVLRPPELGAIRIDITQPAGQLSARLEVESPAAHQLLTESLPQLREVLAPLGVAAEQIQIVRMDWSSSGMEAGWRADGQADAGTSGRGQDAPSQQTTEPQWIDEPERDDVSSSAVQTRTAINLRI